MDSIKIEAGVHLESELIRAYGNIPVIRSLIVTPTPTDAIDMATLDAFQPDDHLVRTWTFKTVENFSASGTVDHQQCQPQPQPQPQLQPQPQSQQQQQQQQQFQSVPKLEVWKLETLYNTLINSTTPLGTEFTAAALNEVTLLMRQYVDALTPDVVTRRKIEQSKNASEKDDELSQQAVDAILRTNLPNDYNINNDDNDDNDEKKHNVRQRFRLLGDLIGQGLVEVRRAQSRGRRHRGTRNPVSNNFCNGFGNDFGNDFDHEFGNEFGNEFGKELDHDFVNECGKEFGNETHVSDLQRAILASKRDYNERENKEQREIDMITKRSARASAYEKLASLAKHTQKK